MTETTRPLPQGIEFNHIPNLAELLPNTKGIPGVEYLQCSVTNLMRAQKEGWKQIHDALMYSIVNPADPTKRVDVQLVCKGDPLRSAGRNSGARLCSVDNAIPEATGLSANWLTDSEETSPAKK